MDYFYNFFMNILKHQSYSGMDFHGDTESLSIAWFMFQDEQTWVNSDIIFILECIILK